MSNKSLDQAFKDLQDKKWQLTEYELPRYMEVFGDNMPVVCLAKSSSDGTTLSYNAYGREFNLHIPADSTSYQFMDEVVKFMSLVGYNKDSIGEACQEQADLILMEAVEEEYTSRIERMDNTDDRGE